MNKDLPPLEEGDIVIKGSYTASSGQEIPVEIHTNRSGLIYQHWRAELERRSSGVQRLEEGQIYEIEPIAKAPGPAKTPPEPSVKTKTLVQVFLDEERNEILARLGELRAQLRLSTPPDAIREEILELEKRLLGDPHQS